MPGIESFASLITELGGTEAGVENTAEIEAPTETPDVQTDLEQPQTDNVQPETDNVTDQQTTQPEAPNEGVQTPPPAEDKSARAFAEMRTRLSGLEKPLKRAAEAAGLSVEEFLAQIENVAINKQAQDQGITPEILRRLETAEENTRAFQVEAAKLRLQQSFNNLQNTFNLTEQDMVQFAQTCVQQGIDLTQPNINMEVLYRGMNYDTLVNRARQEWITQDTKNRNAASSPVKGNGTPSSAPNKVETLSDLEKYLADMPN